MEYTYQVFWNLIATSIWIALRFRTSFAAERPFHISFFALLFLGLFWSALRRWSPPPPSEDALDKDEGILHDSPYTKSQKLRLRVCSSFKSSSAVLVTCVVLRVLILRSIVLDVQCSWNGVGLLIPLLLALHELKTHAAKLQSPVDTAVTNGRSHLLSVLMISSPIILAYNAMSSPQRSTYICPATSWKSFLHLLQIVGVVLDASIITAVSKIIKDVEPKDYLRPLSQMALTSAWTLTFLACGFLYKYPAEIRWSLQMERKTVVDLIFTSVLCSNLIASGVYLLKGLRPVSIATTATCVMAYFSFLHRHIVDGASGQREFIVLSLIVLISLVGLLRLEPIQSRFHPRPGPSAMISRSLVLIMLVTTASTMWFATIMYLHPNPTRFPHQPISALISNARATSSEWLAQAGKSKSLKEATLEYRNRYGILPPPGFDKWYAFAISRKSSIIDDFGQINHDLLPFWGIPPVQIREMTAHMIDRPWTEVGGLRIANGNTSISEHMPGTHRWMVEGAAEMINTFAQWLPDMDLAFNLNDESRVAIPWADMNTLVAAAHIARSQLAQSKAIHSSFSNNSWTSRFMEPEPPYAPDLPSGQFTESSLAPSFQKYGAASCSPSSTAVTTRWWQKQSLCTSCSAPHSLGLYISNWTLAGSLCHQPDLANLHGFHLSPSAFKGTNSLFPIFSQSKIPTFSDVVFPSPWNYKRKVGYEPAEDMPYAQKNNTFFWRGATSEGYAIGGAWMGMQRQRFVHLSNHTLPALLKTTGTDVNVSVSFVQEPTRCGGDNCDAEWKEFDFTGPVDWKEHWNHKHLLDVDGAGFSGRFLPFLESKSLVYRAAGFRQWFEERLTPWRDFIPLDAKGGGDLAALLAFFSGKGKGEGGMNGKAEAERIALEGGEKARVVLRKEDMEVYMFRLLLEWGRVVDDRRGELGFVYQGEV